MGKSMFSVQGNICAERVRLARALQKSPISQAQLALKLNFGGFVTFSKLIVSRIENNERHVIDAELKALAQALGVTMDWLVGDANVEDIFKKNT